MKLTCPHLRVLNEEKADANKIGRETENYYFLIGGLGGAATIGPPLH